MVNRIRSAGIGVSYSKACDNVWAQKQQLSSTSGILQHQNINFNNYTKEHINNGSQLEQIDKKKVL